MKEASDQVDLALKKANEAAEIANKTREKWSTLLQKKSNPT
jgi:hypothetical protein